MNLKEICEQLINNLVKYKSILIYIKGSPDPDVIASSYALKLICESAGLHASITAPIKPSLPQNSAIINELDIPIRFESSAEKLSGYDAYAVLDFQSAEVNGLTGKIPCVVHIDHHEQIEEDIEKDFKLIVEEAGSISSLFSLIIRIIEADPSVTVYTEKENRSFIKKKRGTKKSANPQGEKEITLIKFDENILKKVCTALQYGIYADTDSYRHANSIDFEALKYVSFYSDKIIINHIIGLPLPDYIHGLMSTALNNMEDYKNWIITGIGFIDESRRDSIPIIADYLLKRYKASVVIVFAAVIINKSRGLKLDASFRTEDEKTDLDMLIKEITQSGGGRKYKGAYQVDLNYFADTPDKDMLWGLIKSTTFTRIKHLRDNSQFIEIKGFYKRIKRKAEKIFKY
ncbi:MAG: hypothetical protein V1874_14925 [Spirochaetota bacterium]